MRRGLVLLIAGLLMAITLVACAGTGSVPAEGREVKVDGGSYRDITSAQLSEMLQDKDFLLVNVHIPYEGEIPGTDLFVPYNEIEQNLSQFPRDRGEKIVLYCRSGSMSATAARAMVKSGFTNIWNLGDGMVEWEQQGYELIHRPQ